jgi:hypothetical protein
LQYKDTIDDDILLIFPKVDTHDIIVG